MQDDLPAAFAQWAGVPAPALAGWEMVPLVLDGQIAGIGALSGTEIHFALAPEWRGRAITRRTTREYLQPLIERRGYLTTRGYQTRPEQRDFVMRLGFKRTWTEGDTEHFILTDLPFPRSH